MLEKASELSEDQKYSQALKYYENVLRVDPVNITAIIDYGVTLQNLAYLKHALEMYDMALTIQPKNISALINKGTVLHTMEKYSEAYLVMILFYVLMKEIQWLLCVRGFRLAKWAISNQP